MMGTLQIVGDTLDKVARLVKGELSPGRTYRVTGGVTVRLNGNTVVVRGGGRTIRMDVTEARRVYAAKDGE